MPILLDDIASAATTTTTSLGPKFFDKELTGAGKKAGRINQFLRPGRYNAGQSKHTMDKAALDQKSKSSGSGITTRQIPMGELTIASVMNNRSVGMSLPMPGIDDLYHVNASRSNNVADVYLGLTPQGVTYFKDENGDKATHEINVLYRMEVYLTPPGAALPARARLTNSAPPRHQLSPGAEFVMVGYSFAPLDDALELIEDATLGYTPNGNSVFVDEDALAEWMAEYDVHDRICRLADAWSSDQIAETISTHVEELFANGTPDGTRLNVLIAQLRHLETYAVTLDAYRTIHSALQTHAPADIASVMAKQNLNLLMNSTLEDLEALKPQLANPPQPASAATPLPKHFSTQQVNVITTDEKLTLTQAGAGTGKSTVILARIDHLVSRGVDPNDITVLSFTNAAADNIKEKNPQVGSMTISSMIHDIYSLNHPTHDLSSLDTIMNSMDIFYPNSDMVRAFRRHLMEVDKNTPGATTKLNVFIEKFYDEVIEVLDTLRQTCLELEIILAYQKIDQMKEPAHVQAKYLIIDEVQDNSIFEFIYTLKYTTKHHANMFIVGDASQTLYEFRAANPRALNALEGSGVFATYQLTTNYRSNQEILDFANVHLADIEANQTAGLRLQANSLHAPTVSTFTDKVNLHYELVQKQQTFKDQYADILGSKMMKDYIDAQVAKGEQVAFLMFTRSMAAETEETLGKLYPGKQVANLVSDKVYGTTIFTMFIKKFWNDVLQVPDVQQASFAVTKGIQDNLDALTRNAAKAQKAVANLVHTWWTTNGHQINGWVSMVHSGSLSRDDFFDQLRTSLLDFEIAENRKKFTLTNERNRERKEQNLQSEADFVVSTIHGAKGLEFPHVVIVHKYDAQMPEDAKRMYYVAFTRAMKSEFVLSYGTVKNPRIESDYQLMIDALAKRDQAQALRDAGINPDTASEDEVEAALAKLDHDAVAPAEEDQQADQDEEDTGSDTASSFAKGRIAEPV